MLSIFSWAHLTTLDLLWWTTKLFCLVLHWAARYLIVKFWEFNSRHKSFIRYIFCKDFIVVCGLSFHCFIWLSFILFQVSFKEQTFFNFETTRSIYSFMDYAFDAISKNSLPSTRSQHFFLLCFLLKVVYF